MNKLTLVLLLISFSLNALAVEYDYFADQHVQASSRREAREIVDAEKSCLEVVKLLYTDPYKVRIPQTVKGKKIYLAKVIRSKMVRIFDESEEKEFAPLCKLEVIYQ